MRRFWDTVVQVVKGSLCTTVQQLAEMLPGEVAYEPTVPGATGSAIRKAIRAARENAESRRWAQAPGKPQMLKVRM